MSKNSNIDYILYIDTDSLFINIGTFIDENIGTEWREMPQYRIIKYIQRISAIIEDNVDTRAYRETQRKTYNSAETEFRIHFKQEIIAKSILFVKKKKYSLLCVNKEGRDVDTLETTGLDIVRSETPSAVKPRLRHIMDMILRNKDDDDISKMVDEYKRELLSVYPEEISVNTGVHNIDKYIKKHGPIKGTPWHIKGIYNYRRLIDMLNIPNKYEDIVDDAKTKVVYLMNNQFGIETITFIRWPMEFNDVVQIDRKKMIEKYFINKVKMLLDPMHKSSLLELSNKKALNLFFD